MRVSMDGLRKNLARDYNDVVQALSDLDLVDDENLNARMDELRGTIAMSLCVYDESEPDFHDLSDEIELDELREDDECDDEDDDE